MVHILAGVTTLRDSFSVTKSVCCLLTVCIRIQTTEIKLKETHWKLTFSHICGNRSNDVRKRPQGTLNLQIKVIVKGLFHADNSRQLLKQITRNNQSYGPAVLLTTHRWALLNVDLVYVVLCVTTGQFPRGLVWLVRKMLVPKDVLQLLQISSFMSCSINLYESQG